MPVRKDRMEELDATVEQLPSRKRARASRATSNDEAGQPEPQLNAKSITETRSTTVSNAQQQDDTFELEIDLTNMPKQLDFTGGWHEAVIKSAKGGRSKNGNPMLTIQWVTSEDDPTHPKRSVWDRITFTEDSAWRYQQFFEAIGQPEFKGSLRPSELVGERASIRVVMETRSGINEQTGEAFEPQPAVKRYRQPGASGGLEQLIG